MKFDAEQFRIQPDKRVELAHQPTHVAPLYASKADYQNLLAAQVAELSALQEVFYAASSHAVLFIFQAMDAAGKDSTIRHVMSGVNPQGCQVHSFKHPSASELEHDFLWRTTRELPERGLIGIFNRSYYEEVLIVRVHPEMLSNQGILQHNGERAVFWRDRFRSIVDFEHHLFRNGTRVVKFFLHLSQEEQRKRFLRRIDDPDKNWKLSMGDIEERGYWKAYMQAYEDCLSATSTEFAPWYAIPADDKENARLLVAEVVLETLRALKLEYPRSSPERLAELQRIRDLLAPRV